MEHLKDVESQIAEQRELYSNLTRQLFQLQQDTESSTNFQTWPYNNKKIHVYKNLQSPKLQPILFEWLF